MAEHLKNFPTIVNLLNEHEIGYHSSSHSVHPTIPEFTDLENYNDAIDISLQRETAHINPLTGAVEGQGGINALRDLFPKKQITAFRAPGHCWTPPHLEALQRLGFEYDFSASVSKQRVRFKDVTFYPYPLRAHWKGTPPDYLGLLLAPIRETTVLTIHPSLIVNRSEWDSIFRESNPHKLSPPQSRSPAETAALFSSFDTLLRRLRSLQKMHLITMINSLKHTTKNLSSNLINIEDCYNRSIKWALKSAYKPRFLYQHFVRFFEETS